MADMYAQQLAVEHMLVPCFLLHRLRLQSVVRTGEDLQQQRQQCGPKQLLVSAAIRTVVPYLQ